MLQPRVNPFRFETDGSATTETCVTELTALAGGVDSVAADTCMLGTFGYGQPGLHSSLPACPTFHGPEKIVKGG
jgi:hypothetical protein